MRPQIRLVAALAAGTALGLFAGCSTSDCKSMKGSGSGFGSLFCGGEGTAAPEPAPVVPSACQPRVVMPQFFNLIDAQDASLAGLRAAVKDLGTPVCLTKDADRRCTGDDQCAIGTCTAGLCSCTAQYSPLGEVLGLTLGALAVIADHDKAEPGAPALPLPGCVSAAVASTLQPSDRNRICEIRRTLDVLLQQNGGTNLLNDPAVRRVLLSLFAYVQGKTDGKPHYDLFTGIGRMAAADTQTCDPAALWNLLDNALGYLTPARAEALLGSLQTLLADPQTKSFLTSLSGGGGTSSGRDSIIVIAHGLLPSLTAAKNGAEALKSIKTLLDQLVFNSNSVPQSFKDEVQAVYTQVVTLLSDQSGILPPLQKVLACAGTPEIRCVDASKCTNHDDELVGALYDILSRTEAQGGVDLATLVGALKTLAGIDKTGQTARTLRLVVQGIGGSKDPSDPHEARDAVAALARQALTAEEGQKLVPALSVLVDRQVVSEIFSLLQDVLYTCKPPHP